MVDFLLSDIQREIQKTARDFGQNKVAPMAAHFDESMQYPMELMQQAWELGLLNVSNPEHAGGLGLGTFEGCIISEEMGAACTGVGTAMDANVLAAAPVIVGGSKEQHKRFLGPMSEELTLAAYCVTEPGAGSDVSNIRTTAVKKGDEYVINGSKMWITNGSVASWYFVLAYTDSDKQHAGMSGFVVPANTPGITVGKKEVNLGQRCSDTRSIQFDDVVVPKENLLGEEGQGWFIAMKAFDKTRPKIGAMATGLARGAHAHAQAYAQERKTFGKPIARHQAIQFMLADMVRDIEAARLLVWKAAWEIDSGRRNTKSAAVAKLFAADMAVRVANDALQVFGGYGFNTEYPVEKLYRDAKIFQIYEGTSQIQRLIIARESFAGR